MSSTDKIPFWSVDKEKLLESLGTSSGGLTNDAASARLHSEGYNRIQKTGRTGSLILFLRQFKSPITLILLAAAALSVFLGDEVNAIIIFVIIVVSASLSYWQEAGAQGAVEKLRSIIQTRSTVVRGNTACEIPSDEVVRGDLIAVSAGDVIPGDCRLTEAKDLFVNEASLTGETFPVEKTDSPVAANAPISKRFNSLYQGTHVVSGTGRAIVVHTGTHTAFGAIAQHLASLKPETEFESGIRKFGYLLAEVTFALVIIIFSTNVYLHRPFIDSLLFSLALAVGLTPQLLPAIISVNLAQGARNIAKVNVIVKKLASIENFGSMNVLCSDKTGTLTEGKAKVVGFLDCQGTDSPRLSLYAYLNSYFETGFRNPLDTAVLEAAKADVSSYTKTDEIPYDFVRKRLSIVVQHDSEHILITKGAYHQVVDICTVAEFGDRDVKSIHERRDELDRKFEELSKQGLRIIALAYKKLDEGPRIDKSAEQGLTFLGFIALSDPPKEGIAATIQMLNGLGIRLKVVTGDNPFIAAELGKKIFAAAPEILTGSEMQDMSNEALLQRVDSVDIFAEVEPAQKERILIMLKRRGNVVGYLGDGINDASALRAADVGISVDSAVDVAKESADIVLLNKDLNVLAAGVREGRKTFANTLKYIFMATSANFGNMFSMAGASLFLPFLPLLPFQILLTNLLTDLPEMTIATDHVDDSMMNKPRRWDLKFIKRFMISFGLLSSLFDYVTFGVLLVLLHAGQQEFRTGWFAESVISATLIVLVVRSRGSMFKSRPSKYLAITTVAVVAITAAIPYSPLASLLGFTTLPASFMLGLLLVVAAYVLSAELMKRIFYRWNQ